MTGSNFKFLFHLPTPVFYSLISHFRLIFDVNDQSTPFITFQSPGTLETISVYRSKTNKRSSIILKDFGKQSDTIGKVLGILHLIAKPEDSHFLPFQLQGAEFGQKLVPISRQFAIEPGGSTDYEIIIGFKIILPGFRWLQTRQKYQILFESFQPPKRFYRLWQHRIFLSFSELSFF